MTIADVKRNTGRLAYYTDLTHQYPFSFAVFAENQVVVTVVRTDDSEVTLSSGYSVHLNTDSSGEYTGGYVRLTSAVANAKYIVITSAVPYTQEVKITNKGGFYPQVLNTEYDKVTALCQQLKEEIGRAVKVSIGSGETSESYKAGVEELARNAADSASQAAGSAASASASASSAQALANTANTNANTALSNSQDAVTTANQASANASAAVTTANSAEATANTASSNASEAVSTANTADANASEAKTNAQSALDTVTALQEELPQDVADEVSRQVGEELQTTVEGIVRQVAPEIIEETAASKDYVDGAVGTLDSSLADVAKSGSYDDLTDKPTNVSSFTNDANYLTPNSTLDASKLNVSYLPTAGGTMGGQITRNGIVTVTSRDDSYQTFIGATNFNNGAFLRLHGGAYSENGSFRLGANKNGVSSKDLIGTVDGSLKWDANEVLTTANGLSLSGGTMSGTVNHSNTEVIRSTNTTSQIAFTACPSGFYDGACLTLNGKDRNTFGGAFTLTTGNGTEQKVLQGRTDGILTWVGKEVERVNETHKDNAENSLSYVKFESGLVLCYGQFRTSSATSSGVHLTFPTVLSGLFSINANLWSSASRQGVMISNPSTTGCDIGVFDSAGAWKSGYAGWITVIGFWK